MDAKKLTPAQLKSIESIASKTVFGGDLTIPGTRLDEQTMLDFDTKMATSEKRGATRVAGKICRVKVVEMVLRPSERGESGSLSARPLGAHGAVELPPIRQAREEQASPTDGVELGPFPTMPLAHAPMISHKLACHNAPVGSLRRRWL